MRQQLTFYTWNLAAKTLKHTKSMAEPKFGLTFQVLQAAVLAPISAVNKLI